MKVRHLLAFVTCLFIGGALLFSVSARAEDMAKRQAVLELMQLTGATQLAQLIIDQTVPLMISNVKKLRPDISEEHLDAIRSVATDVFTEAAPSYLEQVIPLYERTFTIEELHALNAFYKTEVGRKAIRETPQLVHASMELGQKWGASLAPLIQQRVQERLSQ